MGFIQIGEFVIDASEMHLPLDGCLAKLDRAAEHLQAIDDEIVRFLKANPYTVSGEIDPEQRRCLFRLNEPPRMLRAGVLIGEYVHQVRSVLDLMVAEIRRWDFAQHGKGLPRRGSRFVIETSPKKFGEKRDRLIGALPKDWQDLIELLQPDKAGDVSFPWIEAVWNLDKHDSVFVVPPAEIVRFTSKHPQGFFTPARDVARLGEASFSQRERLVQRSHGSKSRLRGPIRVWT
ncbi:MAG TPA: hypothetical protein VFA19_15895 [Gaiellaceae bacterium]|nr:hypothetical protein [Gaiellaceae bacterium]